jgi:hypothetical protein
MCGRRRGRTYSWCESASVGEDIHAWEEVVIEDASVARRHSRGDRDVGIQGGIESDNPAVVGFPDFGASGHTEACREFVVDLEQVIGRVALNVSAGRRELADDLRDVLLVLLCYKRSTVEG